MQPSRQDFAHDLNLGEAGNLVVQPVPQPHGDPLQRRRLQPFDLVEKAMVERLAHFRQRRFQIVEMHDHAVRWVGVAVDADARAERMPVHPRIRVSGGGRGQEMSRLEEEFLIDAHGLV